MQACVLSIRTSFGGLLDVVSCLDVRRLHFLLDLEFLIDGIQLCLDFRFGSCDLFWPLGYQVGHLTRNKRVS